MSNRTEVFNVIREGNIDLETHHRLREILQLGFPKAGEFHKRDYFRTPPVYRISVDNGDQICGQISLVERNFYLDNRDINIAGIADLSVDQKYSNSSLGTKLVKEWIKLAKNLSKYYLSVGLASNPQSVYILTKLGYINSPTSFLFEDQFGKQKDFMDKQCVYLHRLNLNMKQFSRFLALIKNEGLISVSGETF